MQLGVNWGQTLVVGLFGGAIGLVVALLYLGIKYGIRAIGLLLSKNEDKNE
jgi:hypothetical protein